MRVMTAINTIDKGVKRAGRRAQKGSVVEEGPTRGKGMNRVDNKTKPGSTRKKVKKSKAEEKRHERCTHKRKN